MTVGRVARAHGIRGDVTIDVRTDEPERRFAPGTRFEHSGGALVVESWRWHSSKLLVRFEGVDDRDSAERLRGIELSMRVSAAELPAEPDEYYDHQLRGLLAVTTAGEPIGVVRDVLHLPSQDVLAIDRGVTEGPADPPDPVDSVDSAGEVLVPFVAQMVARVDLAAGRVEIEDPAGLLAEPTTDE